MARQLPAGRRGVLSRLGSTRAARRRLWAAALLFSVSAGFSFVLISGLRDSAPGEAGTEVLPPPEAPAPLPVSAFLGPELPGGPLAAERTAALHEPPTLRVVSGHIAPGGSLGSALRSQQVSASVTDRISRSMRPLFDFRHAQAGDFFSLIQDGSGSILSFEYQRGRRVLYRLESSPRGALQASRQETPLELRVVRLAGVIERSLFSSVIGLGEDGDLVNRFADLFLWDIDFSSQTRPGDEFRMVVEKFYDRGSFVRYGQILAADYRSGHRRFTVLYYEQADGYGDYYTPEGNSIRRTFLRAPVKYTRISSRYSKSRLHPVLKVRRPHEGIDYVAPMGAPVRAVADGVVAFKGWNGGLGRLVRIRHNNGYTSYYGHLSAYAKGLEVGERVRQKQVIGRVGRSGLATGAHLDYRLRLNGRFVDPLKVRFPTGRPLSVRARPRFEEVRDMRLAELREVSPPLVLEAAM